MPAVNQYTVMPTRDWSAPRGDACAGDRVDGAVDIRLRRRPVGDRDAQEALAPPRRAAEPAGPVRLHVPLDVVCELRVPDADEHLVQHDVVDDLDAIDRGDTRRKPT